MSYHTGTASGSASTSSSSSTSSTTSSGPEYTLTYDEKVRGWTSFHSFIPEYMTNLNNEFFTFKDGQIYLHNQESAGRNVFYGTKYDTEIETIINDGPSEAKIFNVLELEGNSKNWNITINTDIDSGHINKDSFKTKEGFHYSYIRRDTADVVNTELLSVQGVGNIATNGLDIANYTLTFGLVPSTIAVGDAFYTMVSGAYQKIGDIISITGGVIGFSDFIYIPSPGDFCFAAKNPLAEAYGLKGYFATIRLVNSDEGLVEIYSLNAEAIKSFP